MAKPEQDEGVAVLGGPDAVFGDGGQVGLVLHEDGGGQPLLELLDQAPVPGGETGGVPELPGDRVDQAGGADADAVQRRRSRGAGGALQHRHRPLDGGACAGVAADRQGGLGKGDSEQVRDDHGDAVRPDVESCQVRAVGDDPVQPGVGSPAVRAALPDHPDQPGALEAVHQVGDRGTGQAGQGLQLSGRQRAVLLEQSQGEPVVDGPGGARGCGHAGILPDH